VGRQGGDAESQTVGGAGHFGHADGAAGTGLVFHDHGLTQQLAQDVLQVTGHHVGRATGRERHDDAQRARILGHSHAGDRHCCSGGNSGDEVTTLHRVGSYVEKAGYL